MRKVSILTFVLALSAALSACTPEPEEEKTNQKLTLEQTEISVPAEGGRYSVVWEVADPVAGTIPVVAIPEEVGWISDVNVGEKELAFEVAANNAESSRECVFCVSYPGASDVELIVIQSALESEMLSLQINLKEYNESSIVVDVIPSAPDMTYFLMCDTRENLDEMGLTNDSLLLESDRQWILEGVELGMHYNDFVDTGEKINLRYRGCLPETEYVLYGYGLDTVSMEMTTELTMLEITTKEIELIDVAFNVEAEVDGIDITAHVSPQDYDGLYYIDCYDNPTLEFALAQGQTLYEICYADFETILDIYQNMFGVSLDDALAYYAVSGEQTKTFSDRVANMKHTVVVYPLTGDGIVIGEPETVEVMTESTVDRSDNILTLSVEDITPRSAVINVKTTNSDPYIVMQLNPEVFEGMTEEETMSYILTMYYWGADQHKYGDYSEELTGLYPDMEYTVYAFGVENNEPTTQLFTCSFKTTEMVYADVEINIDFDAYYDVAAIKQIDPVTYESLRGDVVLPVKVSAPEGCTFYYGIFYKGSYESDFDCQDYLLYFGQKEAEANLSGYYGSEHQICGFAVDADGNWGPLTRVDFAPSEDGVSDPQEFIDSH